MTETEFNNLHGIERVFRIFTGCVLIGSVMITPFTFEYLVLLPLVGIYPCMTGLVGWDPVYFVFGIKASKVSKTITDNRVSLNSLDILAPRAAV